MSRVAKPSHGREPETPQAQCKGDRELPERCTGKGAQGTSDTLQTWAKVGSPGAQRQPPQKHIDQLIRCCTSALKKK